MTAVSAIAQDTTSTIVIDFNRANGRISINEGGAESAIDFLFSEVRVSSNQVTIRERVIISNDTLQIGGKRYNLSNMTLSDAVSKSGGYRLTLSQNDKPRFRRSSYSGKNRFASFELLTIPSGDFVRGDVFCIGSEIVVEGEVNGNIVALFGSVRLSPTALCQRDVFAIGGKIQKHRQARVYGIYQSTEGWKATQARRRGRASADKRAVSFSGGGAYNRVDGLVGKAGLTFQSEEKFLPKFFFEYGYGFGSKRSKYQLGIEQSLFDYNQTKIGGSVYRQTKTEDEWICDEKENTLYALLVREDFRDYYQGEGGNVFIEQTIGYLHALRLQYSYEQLEFLAAHTDLWSLFGGDRQFRSNFSSVSEPDRARRLADYEKAEGVLQLAYIFNSVEDEKGEMSRAGWLAGIEYQHSSKATGSDFHYDRLQFELRRYQPLTYRQNFNVRLMYGGVNGDVPLHRLFYLGGIRTLRAFDIKELYGTRMLLANAEYVVDFPRTSFGLAALFDLGKTGWDSDFLAKGGWHGDVGIGVRFGKGARLELTRQINGSRDRLQLSVLIGRSF